MKLKALKSLVAEDDATSRALMQSLLSDYGQCDISSDGKEAVDATRRAWEANESYDLICMDLRMPVMDGQQAIREIRQQEKLSGALKTSKIIVTTAYSDMQSITSALLGRCDAYLVKPIDTAKLLAELRTLGLVE
jgi:two-component system chemotaxis response regulator CheY